MVLDIINMPRPSIYRVMQRKKLEAARKICEASAARGEVGDMRLPAASTAISSPGPSQPIHKPTSAEKRKKLVNTGKPSDVIEVEYMIIRKDYIQDMAEKIACPSCYDTSVQCKLINKQADTIVQLVCQECSTVIHNNSSECIVPEMKNIRPVTLMLVYFMMLMGYGYSGVEKLCGLLSIPHFSKTTYVCYSKKVLEKAKENVNAVLERSRKAVFDFYKNERGRESDQSGILDTDVDNLMAHDTPADINHSLDVVLSYVPTLD